MAARRMHADEVPTDVGLVRRLLTAQFPLCAELAIEPVASSGTSNAMYRLGDDLAVRLPRIPSAADHVDKECTWVPRLASDLPFPVPVPLAMGAPGKGYPWSWSVCRWLDGENPTPDELTAPGLLAQDLAQFVVALRRIDAAGGPASGRGVPLASRDVSTRAAIEALHGVVDTAAVIAVWHDALRVPSWPGPPVWLHGDLLAGNVLCVDGRLSAVIDFGSLGVGDPACDTIAAWSLLPAAARPGFREALSADEDSWARGRGWALSIALIQLPTTSTPTRRSPPRPVTPSMRSSPNGVALPEAHPCGTRTYGHLQLVRRALERRPKGCPRTRRQVGFVRRRKPLLSP